MSPVQRSTAKALCSYASHGSRPVAERIIVMYIITIKCKDADEADAVLNSLPPWIDWLHKIDLNEDGDSEESPSMVVQPPLF